MGIPSEEVGAAGVLFASVLGRKDPVRMVMISFAARWDLICGAPILEAHMFALRHFDVICFMHRAELRDVCINVVANVFEEGSCASPWWLQLSVCIGVVAPMIEDCKVNAVVKGNMGESH